MLRLRTKTLFYSMVTFFFMFLFISIFYMAKHNILKIKSHSFCYFVSLSFWLKSQTHLRIGWLSEIKTKINIKRLIIVISLKTAIILIWKTCDFYINHNNSWQLTTLYKFHTFNFDTMKNEENVKKISILYPLSPRVI